MKSLPGQKAKTHYPDGGDNVIAKVEGWLDANCDHQSWYMGASTESGKYLAKKIVCGKEWCPKCGVKGSISHNRRYVRWLSKIQKFSSMRYIVLTIPEYLRGQYRTKQDLAELGRRAQTMIKAFGYKRGLRRWHWFGDRSHKWNPHLNIIVEGSYIKKEKLESIKVSWAKILGTDKMNIRISYKNTPADMMGSLFYITRATFLDYEWDIEMAMELRGFRNMVVWGRSWQDDNKWKSESERIDKVTGEKIDVAAVESIIAGFYPGTNEKLTWNKKPLPGILLDMLDTVYLGAGYYIVLNGSSPGGLSDTVVNKLNQLHLVKYLKSMGAVEVN